MRSPAERRPALERAARLGAVALLGVLAWRAGRGPRPPALQVRGTGGLADALVRATHRPTPSLDVELDSLPGRAVRGWTAALGAAGTRVRWRVAGPLPAIALSLDPLADPSGTVRATVIGPVEPLELGDASGLIESVVPDANGPRVVDVVTGTPVQAAARRGTAIAAMPDSVVLRPVLVLARAGWEGRFTALALAEAGWRVAVDFSVTDRGTGDARGAVAVHTEGAALPIDTSRYSAVVALDETAANRASAIARFVREGGGVVVGPLAAAVPALAAIAPAVPGARFEGRIGGLSGSAPRSGLAARSLSRLRDDAVVLERRGPNVTTAARREQLGRVLMVGFEDTWRWRMQGGPGAPAGHGEWWSQLVSSVARPVLVPRATRGAVDPAPWAALVAALGPPSPSLPNRPGGGANWEPWLLGLCLGLLLLEWGSRRTRGLA